MRKNFLPPALALLGGGVGFGLRKWQLTAGFEPDTGLAIPGAPAALAAVGFSLAIALLFLLLSRKEEKRLSWEAAFAAGRQNTLAVTALVLAAMLLLASAGAEIIIPPASSLAAYQGETPFARAAAAALPPLRILLCVGALPCVFLWARAIFRGEGGAESLPALEPCLIYCVWLISAYQFRAADPVVQDYLYEVLAIVTSLLGVYFVAGHSFNNGKPRLTLLFCLTGVYFSLMTLADRHSLADIFRNLFAVLYLSTHAALILNHPPVENPSAPAEAETEADKNA